jgi:hypothetical protein
MVINRNIMVRDNISENGDDDFIDVQLKKSNNNEKRSLFSEKCYLPG